MIHHLVRNVHTGGRNATTGFHRVIDFGDRQPVIRFDQILSDILSDSELEVDLADNLEQLARRFTQFLGY
jgi:hypothetical protein